ncbi:MAG: hypothetical protein B9S33_00260 [Pedosphaera sp. Tous-C6FEB]|nr:MAG: hypothetical protein B9S33_00260 [Pedosphaera sp. Tous-C6FEB]
MSVRDAILQNFWLKLFSLVLATMIWFAIFSTQNSPRWDWQRIGHAPVELKQVPVTVMKSAGDLRSFRIEPVTVDVTLQGPRSKAPALTPANLEVFINLSDVTDTVGPTKNILVHAPPDFTVVKVSPAKVYISPAPPSQQPKYEQPAP